MVHLGPLPGSPRDTGAGMAEILAHAIVGTSLQSNNDVSHPVSAERVRRLRAAMLPT